jgi:hypothetical protein
VADYSTTQLILDVKRNGSVPTDQALYSDVDFCKAFTDCQRTKITPQILNCKEEFFVVERLYAFSSLTAVAGDRLSLPLPGRSIGQRIRSLQLVDVNGNVVTDIPRLSPERNESNTRGTARTGHMFEGNNLLLPAALADGTNQLRLKYFRRPNELVPALSAAKVVSVLGAQVTVTSVPPTMVAGVKVDLMGHSEPFNSLLDDDTIVLVSPTIIEISPAGAALLSAGDYICLAGETVFPQIPVDLQPILVQYALCQILKSLGDAEGAKMVRDELEELEKNLYAMIAARDEGSAKKIIAPGGLWTTGFRRW